MSTETDFAMSQAFLEPFRAALRERDIARAAKAVQAAVAARALDAPVVADMLGTLIGAGMGAALGPVASDAVRIWPASGALLLALSETEGAGGRHEVAAQLAREAPLLPDQRRMEDGRAIIVLARHLLATGLPEEAATELRRHIARHGPREQALSLLGAALERQGDFAGAAAVLLELAQLRPAVHGPWLRAVRLLLRAAEPVGAVEAAERAAAAIGPNHFLAIDRAGALHACGRFDDAAMVAAAALADRSDSFALHRQRILSLIAAGRIAEAGEATIAMLRTVEANAGVAFTVGLFLREVNDPTARRAFLDRAQAASPHPLIATIGGTAREPVVLRDREPLGREIFPPDDAVLELAAAFQGARLPFGDQLAAWQRRRLAGGRPEPLVAYTAADVTLHVRDGIFVVLDGTGAALDLCARRPDQALLDAARHAPVAAGLDRVFLVNGVGLTNYAHWCLDLLPQIAVAATHFPQASVRVPGLRRLRFIAETLNQFGLDPLAVEDIAPGSYRVRTLTVLNASVAPTARHALQLGHRAYARHLLCRAAAAPRPEAARRRLFVDRPPPQRRTAINRAEMLACLNRHAFEVVDPGRLPVADQAAMFAGASHVVGLHGAALTNLLHCRPGTRVLEIHSPDHSTTAFAVCAIVTGCAYRPHVAHSAAPEGRLWSPPQDMDYILDIGRLEEDLAWLLG